MVPSRPFFGGTVQPDYGKTFDSAILERGLRELCPDLHFDLAGCIGQLHPFINDRQGVYWKGQHICSMDRGMVPEFKLWTVVEMQVPVGWYAADQEGASIKYETIPMSDPFYGDYLRIALRGSDPSLMLHDDGQLVRMSCWATRKVKGRVHRLGWRHTFERLIAANIPNVNRVTVGQKFGVDMMKFPVGSPDEVLEAIWTE